MNVNELLDTIEDALEESANVPLSGGKRIVNVEQIRDYLDEVRAALPGELRQAQQIVNDRAQIVDSANAQAQAIVKKAEERARILVSDAEIVKAAQQRASEITSAAQTEARTLRQTISSCGEDLSPALMAARQEMECSTHSVCSFSASRLPLSRRSAISTSKSSAFCGSTSAGTARNSTVLPPKSATSSPAFSSRGWFSSSACFSSAERSMAAGCSSSWLGTLP